MSGRTQLQVSLASVARRVTVGFCALVVAFVVLGALAIPTASAQTADGLTVSSSTLFTPDPANERIDVQATFVLTNVQPDEVVGSSVRSFFFTKWVIAVPANVTNFAATSNGSPLQTSIEASMNTGDASADPNADPDPNANVVFGSVTLPSNLNFEQSVTLDVTYTIPGGEPRAEGPVARVNSSFLSFSIWTSGDPGLTDVRIAIPDGFSMDLQGDLATLAEVDREGKRFLEATALEEPRSFFGQVFGRNDTGLITEFADLPGAQATVRAWPDDPDWAAFVVDAIEEDVPVIEDLTGLTWPAGDIEVIETVTPYLYGYGGWFNASSGIIEIGETLERDLILHELAHAWFNEDLIEGRWITEGLAEEFASRAIAATTPVGADESLQPTPDQLRPDEPVLDDPLRVQLANWASPWTLTEEDAFAYEQFHYNASWWVIRQITDEVGLETFADVLVSLRNDEMAYVGEGPVEQTQTPTRWTHLFDLLEIQAGASNLDELFGTYVLSPFDTPFLEQRRETLDDYYQFVAAADDWAPPLLVRRDLSAWQFDDADEHLAAALEIVQLRDQVDAQALELDVALDHRAEVPFETSSSAADLAEARAMVQQLQTDLNALAELRSELEQQASELNTTIGFSTMTLTEALDDERLQRDALATVADLRAQVEQRAVDLGVAAPAWPSSEGVTDFGAIASLAQARLATLDAIDTASQLASEPRSVSQRVGLWGANLNDELTMARTSFEADELDDSLAAAARTEVLVSQAASAGNRRLLYAAVAFAAIVLTVVVRIALRRTDRASRSASR